MAAEVRGSELHVAENWEKTDGVATLCRVLLSDGVYACAVWVTIQRLVRFNMHQDGVTASQTHRQPQSEVHPQQRRDQQLS